MEAAVHDAVKPVLAQFADLDEDSIVFMEELVLDTEKEDAGGDARSLASKLEEALEPYWIGWGAEVTNVPGSSMQIAVALRGLPQDGAAAISRGLAMAQGEAPEKLEAYSKNSSGYPSTTAPATASKASTAGSKAVNGAASKTGSAPGAAASSGSGGSGGGGLSLADFCSKAPSAEGSRTGAGLGKQSDGSVNGAAPKTLADLWKDKADLSSTAKIWLERDAGMGADGTDSEEEETAKGEESEAQKRAREKQTQKMELRARRLAASEAAVNALGEAEAREALGDIAAHGLKENRGSAEEAAVGRRKPGRKPHMEGAGGRNVHLEGLNITLTGEQGSKDILREADLHLNAGHVYGLIGKNGSGKTTLLRRLALRALPGFPQHLRVGYVAQELAALDPNMNAIEAVLDADEERKALLEEREDIENAIAAADAENNEEALRKAEERAGRFAEIEQLLASMDADLSEERAKTALTWLSFTEALMRRPIGELSGGWRMRIALARVLNSKPDVLLLDEPTNHLDLNGVLWLQEHLRREWGADAPKKDRIVVAVSHDRSFLDECTTDIVEIQDCKLRNFPGNYSNYLSRVEDEQRLLLLRKNEFEREEKLAQKELKNMKKKARDHADDKKVRQLKSKEKKVAQAFKLSSAREFGADGDDIVTKLREDNTLRFKFPELDVMLDDANLLEVDNASVKIDKATILKNVTLTLEARSRVAIVGGNGAGKSTLMRALAGELKFDEGPRGRGRKHPNYKPGFVSQNHMESQAKYLHGNCVDYLRSLLPDKNQVRGGDEMITKQSDDSVLRAILGNFGLGRDALKKVGYLSGGQKVRLSLSTSTWWLPSCLLLDEPTNHLDVDSLDALTLGLQAFEGPIVVVSHNRGFLEALCDELWIVKDGGVKVCPKGDEAFASFFAKYVKECKASIK
mmetsp:Transcript_8860/g.19682  ORF Transcript_8860/g.19682 Transcript_8860/m.19682 type:complete len:916 (+) Transcript_8860:169-2916(+)